MSTRFNTCPPYFKVESKITRDFEAQRCLPIMKSRVSGQCLYTIVCCYVLYLHLIHTQYVQRCTLQYISILGLFQSKMCVLTGCDALDPYLVYNLTIIYTYCSSIMTASRK